MQTNFIIRMLGSFGVFKDTGETISFSSRAYRLIKLYKFLLIHQGEKVHYELIFNFFSQEAYSDDSKHVAKNMVYRLKKLLKSKGLYGEGLHEICYEDENYYLLTGERIEVDLFTFEQSLSQGQNRSKEESKNLIALFKGPLLEDELYADWTMARRTHVNNLYSKLVMELVKGMMADQEVEGALEICKKALLYDPYEEAFHACILEAYLALNRKTEAILHYEAYEKKLLKEFDVAPTEVLSVFKDLKNVEKGDKATPLQRAMLCPYVEFKRFLSLEELKRERDKTPYSYLVVDIWSAKKGEKIPHKEILSCSVDQLRKVDLVSIKENQYHFLLYEAKMDHLNFITNRIINRISELVDISKYHFSIKKIF